MLLNALWSGHCHPFVAVPSQCDRFVQAFPFPILFLQESMKCMRGIRVYFAEDLLARDLSLGDVLCEELNLEIAPGTMVLLLEDKPRGGLEFGIEMAASILHSLITRRPQVRELAMFDWALRSLSEAWGFGPVSLDPSLQLARDRVTAKVLGLPQCQTPVCLSRHLSRLDPTYLAVSADLGLPARLTMCRDQTEWLQELSASYAAAEGKTRVRLDSFKQEQQE